MKVEVGKKYISNGLETTILCVNRPNCDYPVIGMQNDGTLMFYAENGSSYLGSSYDLVEVWEPVNGEWCLFWDTNEQDGAILSRFCKMTDDGVFQSWNGLSWKHCIKFDGTLPDHLMGDIK